MLKLGGLPNDKSEETMDKESVNIIVNFLLQKNEELFKLVDEYTEARSLSPRQANMQVLNQRDDGLVENKQDRRNSQNSVEFSTNDSLKGDHTQLLDKDRIA